MKAQHVVDTILTQTGIPFRLADTCDRYFSGTPESDVTGVVTTFMATVDVIKKAVELGFNMIITHEPTYFTGHDTTDWLADDPVYLAKKRLLDENGIVIWRYHDHMHMKNPDEIYEGLLEELGWEKYKRSDEAEKTGDFAAFFRDYYDIPKTTLKSLSEYFKDKLRIPVVRIIGSPDMECSRIGILVGGGSLGLGKEEMPMQVMSKSNIDVMVCGEITEWTLCAYVNDAQMLGFNKALLIIGHERSEEWGMKHLARRLQTLLPELPVAFVDAKEPFSYL